jgi:hypothetical protein
MFGTAVRCSPVQGDGRRSQRTLSTYREPGRDQPAVAYAAGDAEREVWRDLASTRAALPSTVHPR